jgi:cytochrome c-type biogenesis protein CcmF
VQDLTIILGHYALVVALASSAWSVIASLLGAVNRGRGLQRSAERAILASTALIILAALCLVAGFLTNDFRLDYVYHYSSSSQSIEYKVGALWGGQAGSLLLWVLILSVMASIMVFTNRRKNRALMPYATAVVGATIMFFMILLNFIELPFATSEMRPSVTSGSRFPSPSVSPRWPRGGRVTSGFARHGAGRCSPGSFWGSAS